MRLDLNSQAGMIRERCAIRFIGDCLSERNIRLLLHRLARIWRASGFGKGRPSRFVVRPGLVFMPGRNDVQASALGQFGIRLITGDGGGSAQALVTLLKEPYRRGTRGDGASRSVPAGCGAAAFAKIPDPTGQT